MTTQISKTLKSNPVDVPPPTPVTNLRTQGALTSSGAVMTYSATESGMVPIYNETTLAFDDWPLISPLVFDGTGYAAGKYDVFAFPDSGLVPPYLNMAVVQWTDENTRSLELTTIQGARLKPDALSYRYIGTVRFDGTRWFVAYTDNLGVNVCGTGNAFNPVDPADPLTGTRQDMDGFYGYTAGVLQAWIDRFGKIGFAGGDGILDSLGMSLKIGATYLARRALKFLDSSGNTASEIFSTIGNSIGTLSIKHQIIEGIQSAIEIRSSSPAGKNSDVRIIASEDTVGLVAILLQAVAGGTNSVISLNNNNVDANVQIKGANGLVYAFFDATLRRLGLGNSTPTEVLDVTGNIKASGTITSSNIISNVPATTGTNDFQVGNGAGTWIKKTLAETMALLGLSGINGGDVTLGAVGSTPNANGLSITGQVLNGQPANETYPGFLTAIAQKIAGTKNFLDGIVLGTGDGTATLADYTLRGAAAVGADVAGKNIIHDAQDGTGAGGSGSHVFRCAPPDTSAVTVENAAYGVAAPNTTITVSIVVGAQANRALAVMVGGRRYNTTITSITHNGVNLVQKGTISAGNPNYPRAEIWTLVNPASGTYNIVLSSGNEFTVLKALSLYNVDQTAPLGAFFSATGTGTSPSVDVTGCTVGNLVIDSCAFYNATPTVGAGQTQIDADRNGGNWHGVASYEPVAAGTTTMSWSLSGSSDWAICAVEFKKAGRSTANVLADAFLVTPSGIQAKHALTTPAPRTITTSAETVGLSDMSLIANYAGTVTLTLPSASAYPGRWITIKTVTNNTVVSASSNVSPINSATPGTAILAGTAGKWADLQSDGTNWIVTRTG